MYLSPCRSVWTSFIDDIEAIETLIEEMKTRLYNIKQEKISRDNVYQFLLFFDKLYAGFTDIEKKTFLRSFLDAVYIYEDTKEDGRILKGLKSSDSHTRVKVEAIKDVLFMILSQERQWEK